MYRGNGRMVTHKAPVQAGTSVSHGKRGPAGVGYRMQQISDTVTRIVGRAYVGNVSSIGKVGALGLTGVVGQQNCLALIFDINPVLLNDRVAVIATTFEKYVYQGVKFTYVPQCPTSIGGSVGMVFDRDPLQISADTQSTQFLSQVMSYEHAVLTPSYVPACTSYTRDPKELKTWFIGGVDATLTTRETSQGNLLVYISNAYAAQSGTNAFNGGYGYIIMDYVLDLVAPTLMPARQVANNINRAPGQWQDLNGNAPGSTTSTTFTAINPPLLAPADVGQGEQYAFWTPDPTWIAALSGGTSVYAPGLVGEIQLSYNVAGVAGSVGPPVVPATIGLPTQLQTIAGLAAGTYYAFKAGQKLYFCVHAIATVASGSTTGAQLGVTFHLSLSSARAAADMISVASTAETASLPDLLVSAAALAGNAASNQCFVSGWARAIAPGASVAVVN